ncbi:hypothetical protein HPY42_01205 [Coprothermobacteraceae bacterium]|nr:hypothetical protein [Coprothermobacteraceae bacterium]
MPFSYADVLAGLLVVALVGSLLVAALSDYRHVNRHLTERGTAYALLYAELYNAPWFTETSSVITRTIDGVSYTVTITSKPGCSRFGAEATLLPDCVGHFKETTVTVEWKSHEITATRASRVLP